MMETIWTQVRTFLSENAVEFALNLLLGFIVLIVGFKLVKYVMKLLGRVRFFERMDPTARSFVESLTRFMLKALLVVVFAGIVGIPTASIIALLGSVGVAIGLAMQGSLSNLAGGVMILLFHPFHKDDYIAVPGVDAGTVTEISIFYTTIVTLDNRRIVVPNGIVSNSSLTNYSVNGTRRIELDFSAAYAADSAVVRDTILSVTSGREKLFADPAPEVIMKEMADSAVIYQLRAWCNSCDYLNECNTIREAVKRCFDERGVSIPFPQLDVYVKEQAVKADR